MDIGPPGVFVNDSCAPNAGIRDDVRLVAITEIRDGDEIFYDYSTTMSENHWTLVCLCGSSLCRGKIGDFKDLPRWTRHRYLRIGIVQSYLARRYYWPMRKKVEYRKEEYERGCREGARKAGLFCRVGAETWRPS